MKKFKKLIGILFFSILVLSNGFAQKIFRLYEKGNLQDFKALIASNPSLTNETDKDGHTILGLAVKDNSMPFIEAIIDNKGDINIQDKTLSKYAPIDYALDNKNDRIVEYLISKGADVNIRMGSDMGSVTPIICAVMGNNSEGVIKLLIEKGAAVNDKSDNGRTALMFSFINNDNYYEYLLNNKADVNIKDNQGNTALMFACGDNYTDKSLGKENVTAIKLMIEKGANINEKNNDGMTPLMFACREGYEGAFDMLLENNVDINMTGIIGSAALYIAARNGHLSMVKKLVSKGAEINAKNNEGDTPLSIAKKYDHTDVADYLMSPVIEPVKEVQVNNIPPEKPKPIIPQPQVSIDTILKLHGSNTIGSKLASALAEGFLKSIYATSISIEPNDNAIDKAVKANLNQKQVAIGIKAHGSGTAFKDLATHSCDIGMSSRSINTQELANLRTLGDLTSSTCENVIGLDGIAIIINRSNPINKLSLTDIARIFSGEITNWSQVDNSMNGIIDIYSRDDKSGTYDCFKNIVLERDSKAKKTLSSNAKRFESNDDITENVSRDNYGIGFVGLPFIKNSKAIGVFEPGSSLFYPTVFSVKTEDYPLARRLFFYIPQSTNNPYVNEFVNYVKSPEGQKIVDEIGFVSMEIINSSEEDDKVQNPDPEYLKETSFAERLSFNFRFKFNSSELDNKAKDDLERLLSYLSAPERRHYRILLFGFADGIGSDDGCKKVALNRANTISDLLKERGVTASSVISFGKTNPVADNGTDNGREKNRRVEAWVKKY